MKPGGVFFLPSEYETLGGFPKDIRVIKKKENSPSYPRERRVEAP